MLFSVMRFSPAILAALWSFVGVAGVASGAEPGGRSEISNASGPQASAELYDPGSGGWMATGDLVVRRNGHTATLLSDGTVLVTGGDGASAAAGRTEQYNPGTGTWGEVGTLHTARDSHTATLLSNGNVLVAGGYGILGTLANCELYDRASRVWGATGDLSVARRNHTATLLPNGKVLVAGGVGESGNLASAELYDPVSGTWSATGSLNTARQLQTATLLPNGKVLVAGGAGNDYNVTTTELYDPASGTWSVISSPNTARVGHTATLLPSGKVLIAGGTTFVDGGSPHYVDLSSAELYDPATGTWSPTGSMTEARVSPTATLLLNAKVLVAAGHWYFNGTFVLDTAELYDPDSGKWSATGSVSRKRDATTATLLPSGKVLMAGGWSPASAHLQNISTRALVLEGDKVAIAGFIIPGIIYPDSARQRVILRALGPSLPSLGGAALKDPVIELYNRNGGLLAQNDNWKINDQTGQSQEADIRATGIAPSNDLESALVPVLNPGAYTALVRGKNGGLGIGLIEVYDVFFAQLANISTRGFVGLGDNAMIGGFIAGPGDSEKERILVRAIGPSLPLPGPLSDPALELRDSNGSIIATNDNWKIDSQTGQSQEAAIRAAGVTPPPDDRESSIVHTFAPGAYTAILRGKDDSTGIALVEVYDLE
jgi:N-acetylneuraminic acid mutarotase